MADAEALFWRHAATSAEDRPQGTRQPVAALRSYYDEPLSASADPRHAQGNPINLPTADDIARLRTALSNQNEILEAILHNLPLGFSMFDTQQRLAMSNSRFRDLFGFSDADLIPGAPIGALLDRVQGQEYNANKPTGISTIDRLPRGSRIRKRDWRMDDGRFVESIVTILPDGSSVGIHEDVTEERRASEHIGYIAHHDALTGLPNRIKFRDEVELAFHHLQQGASIALAHFNLDRFKLINNTLGVSAGDDILCQVADRLRAIAGESDVVARLGSDEFAVLQREGQQPDAISAFLERVDRELARPFLLNDKQVEIAISAGIATSSPDGSDTDALLKNANVALSQAKMDRSSRYRFFTSDMAARIQMRHALEADMRRALITGEFEVHYQPLYDCARATIAGFEALLRWKHPTRGYIPPIEFVPLAEEVGLITDIGRWVLHRACRDAALWPDDVKVAVNVSAMQFRSGDLLGDVMSAVEKAGLCPRRLEIEITESLLMQDLDKTMPALHALKANGIRISMDDFGTGYSSLSYLRSFPFDKIKIDKSFVDDMIEDAQAKAILHAIVVLGKALGMRVTVEGVETAEQFKQLHIEGCDEIQGFFVSKAKPADDVAALLADHGPGRDPLKLQSM